MLQILIKFSNTSTWTIGSDQAKDYDKALYINTWSVEGDNDGTGFKVPFFEYWIEDTKSLGENTLTATLENVAPGSYEVSAWVRVRAKNGVAATDATGITLSANDGEAVDVTEGEAVGTSQFNIGKYTASATVGDDGILKIKFNVAADNNISWLSFKDVKYAAVAEPATAIVNAEFNPEAEPLGWEKVNPEQYYDLGMGLIGTYQVRGEHPAATVDETHPATEYAAGLECRWQTNYVAFTQTTANLPAGYYKLTFDVENTNASTTSAAYENRFTVTVGENVYTDESTEWMNGKSAWTTHTIAFPVEEAAPITISLGYGTGTNNYGVGNTPNLFVSNLQLTTADPVIEAKTKALAKIAALAPVGDALFQYAQADIEAAKAAVEAATTVAEVEAVAMPAPNAPDAEKQYAFQLKLDGETPLYMNLTETGITIAEEATPLSFVETETAGQYNLVADGLYVGLAGGNAWTMSTAADNKAAWTFTALGNDEYYINNLVTAGRFVGTNAADKAAGNPCYADKQTSNGNVVWIITEYVAPTPEPINMTDLTPAMFHKWTLVEPIEVSVENQPCANGLYKQDGSVYGDMSVNPDQYADLSEWDYLTIAATGGVPRLIFNRTADLTQAEGSEAWKGTIPLQIQDTESEYLVSKDNDIYVYDLKAIKEFLGGTVHLNAIKVAGGGQMTTHAIKLSTIQPCIPTWYTITSADGIENGTVSAWEKTVEGAPVKVTATPAEGYELEAINYIAEGEETPTAVEEATFTMPAANVTISATFKKAPEYIVSDLTKEMFHDWSAADATAEITTEEAACDYAIGDTEAKAEGTSLYGNGNVLGQSFADLTDYNSLALTVESGNIRIMLNTVGQSDPKTFIELNNGTSKPYFSINGNTWTVDFDKFKETENVEYVHLNVIKVAWGTTAAISAAKLKKLDETTPTLYAITIAETENGTVEADKAEAEEGATVTITVTPNDGYMVDEASYSYTLDGEAEPTVAEIAEPEEGNAATFTMPAADVTVNITFKAVADPNDYTAYIVNAKLTDTENQGFDATGTKGIDGSGIVKVGNAAEFDFKQTITLPAGQYKLTAQAAYRYGGDEQAEADAIANPEIDTKLVQLYATVGENTEATPVQNRYDGASETDYANGEGSVVVNEKYVPNSSAAVQAWFAAGQYVNEVTFNLLEDGDVTIGINRTGTPESDYTVIGPWTLTRLGDAIEPEPEPTFAEVKMTYVSNESETGDADKAFGEVTEAKAGFNKIANGEVGFGNTTWNRNYITYISVDASAIAGGVVKKATMKAELSGTIDDNKRVAIWGVGYNNSTWSADMTYNTADKSITVIDGATYTTTSKNADTFENAEFDITAAFAEGNKTATILVYETAAAGAIIKNVTVEVEMGYPEIEVDGILYAVKSDNLFKNGSFDNGVDDWKTVGYTTDAVLDNFTYAEEGGFDGGAFITTNGAGVGSEKTLRQSVAVEEGKQYYFTVYTSGKAPDNHDGAWNFQYNALFKMTDATTENGVIKPFEWPQGEGQTATEWSQTEHVFTAETPYVGVRMGWNSASSFDGFALYEVEQISTALEAAQAKALTALNALAPVGDGLFMYAQADIDEAKAAVAAATTIEEVEAITMPTVKAPDATKAYVITNVTAPGKLSIADEKIAIADDATVYFTAVENGFVLSNADGEYVAMKSGSTWAMTTTTDIASAYVVSVIPAEGGYAFKGANGIMGLDYGKKAADNEDKTVYADKSIAFNGVWTIAEYVEPTEKTIEIAIERMVGLGYSEQNETMDFAEAAEFLGVEAVTNDMLRVMKSDNTLTDSYGTYDGWFNKEGFAETWGANSFINIKLWRANDEGKYSIQDMGGDQGAAVPAVGDKVTVKWAAVANEKTVFFNFNVTFVEAPVPELTISDVKVQKDVIYDNTVTSNYAEQIAELTDEEVQSILTELNLTSLDEAKVYGYNPSDESFVVAYAGFDGWRDANGDFAMHTGTTDVPACCKYTDGKSYYCYNIAGVGDKIVKTYWAIANDEKAVLVEVDFWFGDAYTGIDGIASDGKAKANGKYLENGKVVIYRNGQKFSTTGVQLK
ncbi:MAG: hypothetical protein J6M19_05570 [Bacteroidaceae bacterium]|nr:hypothetical protein [Bacteroidaceae bacterium]